MARIHPLRNFRYRLGIDSITQAAFSEVMIGETTIDAVDYREGTDPPQVRKLSELTKYGNITLKWGVLLDPNPNAGVSSGERTGAAQVHFIDVGQGNASIKCRGSPLAASASG